MTPPTLINRRTFIGSLGGLALYGAAIHGAAGGADTRQKERMLGMYVHRAWPYRRPYASRSWTLKDWRGFAEGLRKLGYNTIIVWPVVEIMPMPPTPSDVADLQQLARVIDMLHGMKMKVYATLCPNIMANDSRARKVPFQERHYFHSLDYVDPADHSAIEEMVSIREKHFRPLAQMDGCVIIDSDTGSFPGAKNDDFVNILIAHRKMLDRLRPGIELLYWMHVGWVAYARYHATGKFEWASRDEVTDLLTKLKAVNPAPWGISVHSLGGHEDIKVARELGLESRAVYFNYGAIEGEPIFPLTNFGGETSFKAGQVTEARGVVGNAQTHCLQLPNIFAFSRGFQGAQVAEIDYVAFAEDLVPGRGHFVVRAWKALNSEDVEEMRAVHGQLASAGGRSLKTGRLKGLLFGDAQRFLSDLSVQLEFKIAGVELINSSEQSVDGAKLKAFVAAAEKWRGIHGYQCMWNFDGRWHEKLAKLDEVLKRLNSEKLNTLLAEKIWWSQDNPSLSGATPFEKHQDQNRKWDTHTVRLFAALKEIADKL